MSRPVTGTSRSLRVGRVWTRGDRGGWVQGSTERSTDPLPRNVGSATGGMGLEGTGSRWVGSRDHTEEVRSTPSGEGQSGRVDTGPSVLCQEYDWGVGWDLPGRR